MLVAARLGTRVIDVATMSVLARNLAPSAFGLVSVAMTLVLITEAVFELPVNEALVRQSRISTAQYDTAFTLGLLRGLVLSSVIVLLAWPFARFYADRRLVALLCVLSVAPFARGMRSPRLALYHKEMSFWRDVVIDLVGKCAGFAASVTVCLLTRSYWSIAVGTITYPLAMAVLSYMLAPYRLRLSLTAMSSFSGFLGWISAAQILSAVNWQSDRLLLAKLITNRELGIFSAASDLATIPMLALFGPLQRPLLSAFSHLQSDTARLRQSYQMATTTVMTIGLPFLVGISFVASPLVHLLLGAQWLGAAPLLRWLALGLIPSLPALAVGPFVMTLNRTRIFARNNLVELGVKLPILLFGVIQFGLYGAIAARFASALAGVIFSLNAVRPLTGVRVVTYLSWFWRGILGTLIMALVLMVFVRPVPASAALSAQLTALLGIGLLGACSYAAALGGLWALSGSPAEGIEHVIVTQIRKRLGRAVRPAG